MAQIPGPKAQAYVARDREVVSPSYTRSYPFVMDHGRGSEVWDVDGHRFVDFTSGVAVTSTGHCHPEVVQAIKDQAEKFIHMSGTDFYYPVQIELAEYLSRIAPFSESGQVFFANSGAEAIEAGVKLARYVTGRPRFLAFYGGFHGRTLGALAFTASKPVQRRGFFPTLAGVEHVPYPDPYRPIFSSHEDQGLAVVRFIEEVVLAKAVPPDEVAAILVEPIQGEGGYIVPPPTFFPALRKLCDRHGILLMLDEVQCGMGRTGKWFAIQHEDCVEPDIVSVAKGIASGMPLGTMIARRSLMTWPAGAHASTFGGNPISCAAALTTLRLLENGMMDNATKVGNWMMERLQGMMEKHPLIGNVRGRGLMIGVEIVKSRETRERAHELRNRLVDMAFEESLLLLGAGPNTIRMVPPLNVPQEIAEEALDIFERVLTKLEEEQL